MKSIKNVNRRKLGIEGCEDMIKLFGILFIFLIGVLVGIVVSAKVLLDDVKGEQKFINDLIKKYGRKES